MCVASVSAHACALAQEAKRDERGGFDERLWLEGLA